MLKQIVDLHVHSKYSRACSPQLDLPNIAAACNKKGIDIIATGDFTHPAWFKRLEENLEETSEGVYELRDPTLALPFAKGREIVAPLLSKGGGRGRSHVRFVLGTEISCIYSHKDKTRRLHLLIFAPNLEAVRKFNAELEKRGVNLKADGRPIMGLSGKEIVQICLDIDKNMWVVPAHAWTPWFAVFGSKSGYDSLEECFEELTPHITAIETGLSSDPTMNRRLSRLDNITLISNSDAHSLEKLGREANILQFNDEESLTYAELKRIITTGDRKKFLNTIEFYPEEGKYYADGHADCKISLTPEEAITNKLKCPKCQRPLTVGVLHRVVALADRDEKEIPKNKFIPHQYAVPLLEIIAGAFRVGVASKKVRAEYESLIKKLGAEFDILLNIPIDKIEGAVSNKNIAFGIQNMRAGKVAVKPGYDGIFGVVDVFSDKKYHRPVQTSLL
ncbi:MAG: endonuclease Q family protein [Candidatus Magasanikbacteria bacterium]|nr:endonuclease Q family protein [Candidatus Magasanikbacteria bacterium]